VSLRIARSPRLGSMALALVAAACSSDKVNSPTTGPVTKWVITSLTLPTKTDSLGFDLNGDGRPDNALGYAFHLLGQAGIDVQGTITMGVDSGALVQLLSFQSDDPALQNDAAASAVWYAGQPSSGGLAGAHAIDGAQPAATFTGALIGSAYASQNPATTSTPVSGVVQLSLYPGVPVMTLPLNGMHIQWSFQGTTQIVQGQINGSIRASDVDNVVIPQLTSALNATLSADTASGTGRAIESLFDTGGCGSAVAGDYVLDECEVAGNALLSVVLQPDVQIYNTSGGYAPSAANSTPNALSFGVAFTAAPTTF